MYYDLNRFELAQEGYYEQARMELQNGKKESHWMWFIFPQIAGLGRSQTAKAYEIAGVKEAAEYLKDDLLSKSLFIIFLAI